MINVLGIVWHAFSIASHGGRCYNVSATMSLLQCLCYNVSATMFLLKYLLQYLCYNVSVSGNICVLLYLVPVYIESIKYLSRFGVSYVCILWNIIIFIQDWLFSYCNMYQLSISIVILELQSYLIVLFWHIQWTFSKFNLNISNGLFPERLLVWFDVSLSRKAGALDYRRVLQNNAIPTDKYNIEV